MRYAILVCGPAGAGKSTFCTALQTHMQTVKRTAHLFNLDPAADPGSFEYEPAIDIRDLISLDDVMEELGFGPNGGLIYCFEYLLQNMDWLDEELGDYDNDYIVIDCPESAGQIELYTHHPLLPTLMSHLSRLGIRLCGVYLLDSQFMEDRYKYFRYERLANTKAHTNITYLVGLCPRCRQCGDARNGVKGRRDVARFLDPDPFLMQSAPGQPSSTEEQNPRFHHLNEAIIEDHPLVSFLPLNLSSTRSLDAVLSHIDYTMQYGEDEEPREPKDMDQGDFVEME
ncbi:ATP(GTP)-binding protein Fet5 [Rhizoctonia solani AG-1 IA]|uniref:GPN-loop GTPase 3 n=1 Tax=Thanatephorus cucumeris (strain AG1-IA) TaxID=983506 RepID=L8WYA3_THACA|nr:ATP(GTP)-binding protein Fet5 [Rhizoctonia solani AG-1 IA]